MVLPVQDHAVGQELTSLMGHTVLPVVVQRIKALGVS